MNTNVPFGTEPSSRPSVTTPASVCQSFPESPPSEVSRDNILDTLETLLGADATIVAIEGQDGAGKTTLLTQFVRRHSSNTICLFISSSSRWAYDISQLRYDLCNQLEFLLHGSELDSPTDATDSFLGSRLTQLRKRARRGESPYYFVVDGLEEIPKEDESSRRLILDLLPLGLGRFRFLFSGPLQQLPLPSVLQTKSKSHLLTFFTFDETTLFFAPHAVPRQYLEEFHRTSRGMPGYLAAIRRLLTSGVDPATLAAELPKKLPQLFEIEWRSVNQSNRHQIALLAMIAHARRLFSIKDLIDILGESLTEIQALTAGLSFLVVDHQRNDEVRYVSESFRRFAADRLSDQGQSVHNRLIDYLLRHPNNAEALLTLPQHYSEAGRLPDLLNYLSPEHFAIFLNTSPSLKSVLEKADLGIRAAKQLHREGDQLRFTLQRATITDFADTDVGRAEVRALAALNDYDTAISLAQAALRQEDRLSLLAAIARARAEHNLASDPEVSEQILHLHKIVDYSSLGSVAEEIAGDLVYAHPDLAVDAVNRAAGTVGEGDNALDWAFARLALRAAIAREKHEHLTEIENIATRIKDPIARRISTEASLIFGKRSADEVISQAQGLDGASERLFVLRHWLTANRTNPETGRVLEVALKLAIQATGYSPNALIFRELATCLPYLEDKEKAKHYVSVLDSQMGSLEQLGPTEEFVRLNLILARTEHAFSAEGARGRLIDTYLRIDLLDDLATKTSCLARFLASLRRIDPSREYEVKDTLHSLAQRDFDANLRKLLATTADHYDATSGIVQALAWGSASHAVEVALQLNMPHRRDAALRDFIGASLSCPVDDIELGPIQAALQAIADRRISDDCHFKLIMTLSQRPLTDSQLSRFLPLFLTAHQIGDASDRARAIAACISLFSRHPGVVDKAKLGDLHVALFSSWEAIDLVWNQIEAGFEIVADLAHDELRLARQIADRVSEVKARTQFPDQSLAAPGLMSLSLAIRAFAGLLPRRVETEEDFRRLSAAITSIDPPGPQAQLWAELALRYYSNNRLEDCRRIISDRLKPLLHTLNQDDRSYRAHILADVAPALYVGHPATAIDFLSPLKGPELVRALSHICQFLFRKRPLSEPYELPDRDGYDISYEDVVDIIDILRRIEDDATVYYHILTIVDSLSNPRRRDRLSNQQRAEISRLLTVLADAKFPKPGHIEHEGFKIAARAQINRLLDKPAPEWRVLIDSAHQIPNTADRAYVLATIGTAQRDHNTRNDLFKEAQETTDLIPTITDQVDRYEYMGRLLLGIDNAMCKRFLTQALHGTLRWKGDDASRARRSIVDLAYRIDPDFASSLASAIDDDPAKKRITRQVKLLELQRSLADPKKQKPHDTTPSTIDVSRAAWMRLGSLIAGRSATVHVAATLDYLDYAAKQPLNDGYPIFAWVIENAVARHARTDQVSKYVLPFFEASMLGTEMAIRAATRAIDRTPLHTAPSSAPSSAYDCVTIGPGQRQEALDFIRKWLRSSLLDYLKISEPYFGPNDLDLLKLIGQIDPRCSVRILASKQHQTRSNVSLPWDETYASAWRSISDDSPPRTEIIIVGTRSSGDSPIHDRWWITNGGGLELGTSWNSLGVSKVSDIRVLSPKEAESKESELDKYLRLTRREFAGTRITYSTILLGDD